MHTLGSAKRACRLSSAVYHKRLQAPDERIRKRSEKTSFGCMIRLARKAILLWSTAGVVVVIILVLWIKRNPQLEGKRSSLRLRYQFGQQDSPLQHDGPADRLILPKPEFDDFSLNGSHQPRPLLRLLVLTFDRARSLTRCLESLNAAEYDGQQVALDIFLDRARDGHVHNATLAAAKNFSFKHGPSQVHVHSRHVGVYGQWLGTWRVPADNESEIAMFLEDDVSVSPFFARWLWRVHAKYDVYPAVNGYALQGESVRHGINSEQTLLEGPPGESVFLYPVLGTWGFSPNAAPWKSFIKWYEEASRQPKFIPHVPGLKPSLWYRKLLEEGREDSMWSMWHIYHSYQNHFYTLYVNLPERQGLSHNWKEPGMHYSSDVTKEKSRANLMTVWREEDLRLPERPVILDANGHIVEKLSPPPLE